MKAWKINKTASAVISYLPVVSMLALVATLPFYYGACQRMALYCLGVTYLVHYIYNRCWESLRWDRTSWVFLAMILWFLITPLWQLWDPTPPTYFYHRQIDARIPFLLVGLAGLLGGLKRLRAEWVGWLMLTMGVVVGAISLYYMYTGGFLREGWDYYIAEVRAAHINSHMVLNLYQNGAIILGYYILSRPYRWWVKLLTGLLIVLNMAVVITSFGRTGMLTMLLLLAVYLFVLLWQYRKAVAVVVGCLVLVGGLTAFLQSRRFEGNFVKEDSRWIIWDYSMQLIRERPVVGYGLSTLSEVYVNSTSSHETMQRDFIDAYINNPGYLWCNMPKTMEIVHPHNVFLEYWLEAGIFGLLAVAFFFATLAMMPTKKQRLYVWMFALALLMQFMFEPIGSHLRPMFISLMVLIWACAVREEVAVSAPNHTELG